MKIAIAGKGGVGKTTLAAALACRSARQGRRVITVDADPDGNLGEALGCAASKLPEPIAHMRELIAARTEAKGEGPGLMFRMNPKVDDLPDRFAVDVGGVKLLVLGTVEKGAKGCMCPEGALLKALLQHLLLRISEDVILDMEAGLEHLGRASARGVDAMITVVEPGMRSVRTAERVRQLAAEIGIPRHFVVANKIKQPAEREALERALGEVELLGFLPYSAALAQADLEGRGSAVEDDAFTAALEEISLKLEDELCRNH